MQYVILRSSAQRQFRPTFRPTDVSMNPFKRLAQQYAAKSNERPYLVAAMTGGVACFGADVFAQYVTRESKKFSWDQRRSIGMATFGTIWYGGPLKLLYMGYARLFGEGTLRAAAMTASFDACIHTPFLLLPNYYLITGLVKGKSLEQIKGELQKDWFEASTGMAFFWLPVCTANFLFVPQHSRVLFLGITNFVNKTFLSWLSNRQEGKTRIQTDVQMELPAALTAAPESQCSTHSLLGFSTTLSLNMDTQFIQGRGLM